MLGIYCRTSREVDFENSTIIQQRLSGIAFAEQHKFEYELYEDEGISGFKISDDEQDPFNNRPAFTDLINDIKSGEIDKVWVWEHSRLSRNQYASAFIFNVFEKYKVTLYENQKEFKLDDPQLKFMRQMLDAVAEYERQLIVARTTRGLRKRINEGKRAFVNLFGYDRNGKDKDGHTIWIPVESELNTYQYALKRYIEGASLIKICHELYNTDKIDKKRYVRYSTILGKILRRYQYTGYQLTIEGYDIYKKFRKNEMESLNFLADNKYWVKSHNYPIELISIDDWIRVCEKLQIKGRQRFNIKKDSLLRASKDIATGLMECGDCGVRFYYHELRQISKKTGKTKIYFSYFHMAIVNSQVCMQRPRSFKLVFVNEIFKSFYFYFKVVFDNRSEQIKERLRTSKQIMTKNKERQIKIEKEITAIETRMARFQKRANDPDLADDLFDIVLRNINSSEKEHNELDIELSKLKIEYELENEKYNKSELEMTYDDVKEKVNDWFFKLNVEDQRNELIRTIKSCKVYHHYLLIDTGNIVFLFDIFKKDVFDMNLLDNLNKDYVYKKYFTEMKNKREARMFNERQIHNIVLDRNKEIRMRVFQYLINTYNITYDISEKTNLISFVPLTGLLGFEVEQFGSEG